MKKFVVFFSIIVVLSLTFFFFTRKESGNGLLLNNKNHEYVLSIIQSSAENKKKNFLSNFYFDKTTEGQKFGRSDGQKLQRHTSNIYGQDAKELIEKYNNLLKKNKKINPVTRADIYCFLGNVYFNNKDYANAVYCYRKALFFAPYITEIKYGIKNFVNFTEKINVPEKILGNNNEKSIKQLQNFVQDKEVLLNKEIEKEKNDLKNIYSKSIKLNDDIKSINNKSKETLKKEIFSLEKEKENTEKERKALSDKALKQEIPEIKNIKKELLKDFSGTAEVFDETLEFWKKLEKSVIKRISKNFVSTESKSLQDKYFITDLFVHKKNIWKILIEKFKDDDKKYNNTVARNVYFINCKKQNIFNELNEKEKKLLSEIIETDVKVEKFFARRAKHLSEEKDNVSYLLKEVSAKKKELYSELAGTRNSNEQKKKNLQRELDKIKEKEKAVRQEYADCSKDLAELDVIRENILIYNKIFILDIRNYVLTECVQADKMLNEISGYISFFSEKQKNLLMGQQDILRNVNLNCFGLKKDAEDLAVCDENFSNMAAEQLCLFQQKKLLISNYISFLEEIKQNIESSDTAENGEFFNKLKTFINEEIKLFDGKEKSLNKSFEYDKIYSLQTDITTANLTAKAKIETLEDVLERKDAIKNLFPKKQEPKKAKSIKHQEKVIVSKMKNYEVSTETVKEEIKEASLSKKGKKKKKKKK